MLQRNRFDQLTAEVGAANVLGALSVEEIVSLAEEALAMGAKIVLLKMGIRGVYLRTATTLSELGRAAPTDLAVWANRQLWAPCFRPDVVVSTVGTGDAAIAGFLAAMLRDTFPSLALNVAVATGACCVEVAGALGGLRDWEKTLARIEAGWARLPLELESFGWAWDDGTAVWHGPADRERAN
jgi:sugar/nucleoside kinase (ribokinase family)